MNAESLRQLALTLPHTTETMQWGETLVLWVGDRSTGGKMFSLIALDAVPGDPKHPLLSFAAGPELASTLLELEDVLPAPYLARAHWVAVTRWDTFTLPEWRQHLAAAHSYVLGRLPARTRTRLLTHQA